MINVHCCTIGFNWDVVHGSWLRNGTVSYIPAYQSLKFQLSSSLEGILNKVWLKAGFLYLSLHVWCSKECPRSFQYRNIFICATSPAHQYRSSAPTVITVVIPWEASSETLTPPVPSSWRGLVWVTLVYTSNVSDSYTWFILTFYQYITKIRTLFIRNNWIANK